MKRHAFWALMAVLVSAAPLAAAPMTPTGKSIQAEYDRRDAALAQGDIEGYLAVCRADYRDMDQARHPRTLDQQRQVIIGLMQQTQRLAIHEAVQNVTLIGKDALVTIVETQDVYLTGGKPGAVRHFHAHVTGRAFWVTTPQGWRLKQERTLTHL